MSKRNKGLHFYKRRKTISVGLLREIGSWVFFFVLAVLIAFVFVYSAGLKTSVIGAYMEPCLYIGQSVLINKISYSFGEPKRGDVIVPNLSPDYAFRKEEHLLVLGRIEDIRKVIR